MTRFAVERKYFGVHHICHTCLQEASALAKP
jgi:hypothetical protein